MERSTILFQYDDYGRLIKTTDDNNFWEEFEYNDNGNLIKYSNSTGYFSNCKDNVSYDFNTDEFVDYSYKDNYIITNHPFGFTTVTEKLKNGLPIYSKNSNGLILRFNRNTCGRLESIVYYKEESK